MPSISIGSEGRGDWWSSSQMGVIQIEPGWISPSSLNTLHSCWKENKKPMAKPERTHRLDDHNLVGCATSRHPDGSLFQWHIHVIFPGTNSQASVLPCREPSSPSFSHRVSKLPSRGGTFDLFAKDYSPGSPTKCKVCTRAWPEEVMRITGSFYPSNSKTKAKM